MEMPVRYVSHNIQYCQRCGEKIEKRKNLSWVGYSKRKFCSNPDCYTGRGKIIVDGGRDNDISVSKYIGLQSRNGRLMADFNLGVLKAIEKVKDDGGDEGKKGIICKYKGVPITADVVKVANQWLMDNWIGKAGQRSVEGERDDRPEVEKLRDLEYTLKEMGYKLEKIDDRGY